MLLGPFEYLIRDPDGLDGQKYLILSDTDESIKANETWKMLRHMKKGEYDALIHAGDYAYNIEDDHGMRGDYFFRDLSRYTRSLPFLGVLGNHEQKSNGSLFNYRFLMPGSTEMFNNSLFSVVRGSLQLTFINYDYFLTYGYRRSTLLK